MKELLYGLNFGMILALIIALAGIIILIYSFIRIFIPKK
jgi:flagellar biogenesis protein FliO